MAKLRGIIKHIYSFIGGAITKLIEAEIVSNRIIKSIMKYQNIGEDQCPRTYNFWHYWCTHFSLVTEHTSLNIIGIKIVMSIFNPQYSECVICLPYSHAKLLHCDFHVPNKWESSTSPTGVISFYWVWPGGQRLSPPADTLLIPMDLLSISEKGQHEPILMDNCKVQWVGLVTTFSMAKHRMHPPIWFWLRTCNLYLC